MSNLIKTIKAWHRKPQRSLERWEQITAQGLTRFVLHEAMQYAVIMCAGMDVSNYIFGRPYGLSRLRFHIVTYLFVGLILGRWAWSREEAAYNHACISGRLQSHSNSQTVPLKSLD